VTARAHVESDFTFDGVKLMMMTKVDGGRILRTFDLGEQTFVPSGEAGETPQGRVPYLRFTDEEARAVYQALGEYFGTQVSDNRLLRADYEAERRRVDRFIEGWLKVHTQGFVPAVPEA
jgi:hypothetical protein